MLCEKCGKLPAGIHFKKIVNGVQSESYLCSSCAAKMGLTQSPLFGKNPFMFENTTTACPTCGQSLREFNSYKKMGCEDCYSHFERILDGSLSKIQYGKRHVGKGVKVSHNTAPSLSEIDSLKLQLADAIKAEEYERAATLRDSIRELENKKGGEGK